jgi:chromatin remodeling complex protein RSC6
MATPSSPPLVSRIQDLFNTHYERIRRIEALEAKMDERATRLRRRMANLMEQPRHSHRSSQLRLFVTHTHAVKHAIKKEEEEPSVTVENPPAMSLAEETEQEFILQIEGRLLVDHLDHLSAAEFDARTKYTAPNDDLDRSQGEKEEEYSRQAIHFSHFFDQAAVRFQPVYSPKRNPMSKKKLTSPKSKSSRRVSASKAPTTAATTAMDEEEDDLVDPSQLVRGDNSVQLVWTRNMTLDSRAFYFHYKPPPPPGHHLQLHSVVAKIHLYPHRSEELFQVSSALADVLFPGYGPSVEADNKKRKADEMTEPTAAPPPVEADNEISVPQGLTMREITNAFFTYIYDRNLASTNADKSVVACDDTLRSLFDNAESFPFCQLQQLLLRHNLLRSLARDPVELTYILKSSTASPLLQDLETHNHNHLSIDMDVLVPAYFPFRIRQLMRRVKRRELEYTSACAKGRQLLTARRAVSDGIEKAQIDKAVNDHSLHPELQPVYAALAKSAPANSEARRAAQINMQLCYLFEQLNEHYEAALAAWDTVERCQAAAIKRFDS